MSIRSMAIWEYAKTHSIEETDVIARKLLGLDGGPGSGNFGHGGRPGKVGGSAEGDGRTQPRAREYKDKPEKSKAVYYAGKPKDVTNEYKMRATPGKGKKLYEDGYSEDGKEEKPIADWLIDTFGGNVLLLNRLTRWPEKSPDFLWRGKLWDLKTPNNNSENAIRKCLEFGKTQIRPNPGGVIMDLDKCGAKIEEAEQYIIKEAEKNMKFSFDVIILHRGKNYKVLRFDKEKSTK